MCLGWRRVSGASVAAVKGKTERAGDDAHPAVPRKTEGPPAVAGRLARGGLGPHPDGEHDESGGRIGAAPADRTGTS